MTETVLPPNTHRVAQRAFDAIPGSPWAYWIPDGLRRLFEELPSLGEVAQPRQGLATADNFRFLRFWWEVGRGHIAFGCRNRQEAIATGKKWFPCMKGGAYCKWYGNQEYVVNWDGNGKEMRAFTPAVIRNPNYYFREGSTFTDLTSGSLSIRWMPPGFVFDHAGNCVFPSQGSLWEWLALLNSKPFSQLMHINPTIHFYISDFNRMPVPLPELTLSDLVPVACHCTRLQIWQSMLDGTTFDFIVPPPWHTGLDDLTAAQARLTALEAQIDDEVYRLYSISDEDRAAIEAELAGGSSADEGTEDETEPEPPMTAEELAVRWISYAAGIVLGRFQPGLPPRVGGDERGALGSAIYRRDDFAVGSLPAPDEAEFDQLVGPAPHPQPLSQGERGAKRFAYADDDGGRHVFPVEVEAALRDLALPDGIAVLDEGHRRDLPALVEQALQLMLDRDADTEHAARKTHEVIEIGAGGDLRRFFERNFFTRYHFRWYRKRPVYWPLQSARRSYGFVLFHERVDRSTLYALQRDYLDHKLNGLRLEIGDLQGQAEPLSGAARKRVERQIDGAAQLLEEVTAFAQAMERVVRAGYEPAPDWIDDGVILRMAPLWELIPLWKSEPKKYWERLQRGDYDWSHIAKRYWPERVREKCKGNKSFAIAHGHEKWYEENR